MELEAAVKVVDQVPSNKSRLQRANWALRETDSWRRLVARLYSHGGGGRRLMRGWVTPRTKKSPHRGGQDRR
jgi:hypothetical protein